MKVKIKDNVLAQAAEEGMDKYIQVIVDAIYKTIGGKLIKETMNALNADQITLLAYITMRDEIMDGGFVQLIYNGWGHFIFNNPFDKAVRNWGIPDLCSLVRHAHKLYTKHHTDIEQECNDDEFMALFERFSDFDTFDDEFVECEENFTSAIAHYVDNNLEKFCEIEY